MKDLKKLSPRERWYEIIFEADTKEGRLFNVVLLTCILASVAIIVLESVAAIREEYGNMLRSLEWTFTIIFTAEYVARIWTVNKKKKYIFSLFGIIDFLSILPSFLALFVTGTHSLMVIRSLRLLRIFRIFKLSRYVGEGQNLARALKASQHKITVFLVFILTSVVIAGTIMYLVEGPEHGFTSIPVSIYWAIVTMTTVGYGDIAPETSLGQTIASIIMIMGYGIIAVPTGIVSSEMISLKKAEITTQVCPHCFKEGHDSDARFCKYCGGILNPPTQ
ncbi:MAG TPA: ion transporter [Chryseosolibacter sp.]